MAGVMKYLLVMVVLALAIMLWLRRQQRQNAPPAQALPAAENMARCAHCGIHVPQSQTLHYKGRRYCCPAHRDLNLETAVDRSFSS